MAFINNVKIPSGSTYDIQAKSLAPLSLNSTTLNNTSGTFAFRGYGQPWTETDWVGFQIGDDRDKFQITYTGENLLWRQNDSGGTNSSWTAWKPLPTTTYSLNISTGSNSTIRLLNGATTVTSITVPNTTNTTYGNVTSAAAGLAPAGGSGTTKYLRQDGSWQVPPDHNTTYTLNASTGSNSTIRLISGSSTVASITIPNTTNTTYGNASTSAAGLMSADDKKKLNACSTVDHNTTYSAGTGLTLSTANQFYTTSQDVSDMMNLLGEGTSLAGLNDYLIAQYAGGGNSTKTYHRRKVSNVVNSTVVKHALGCTTNTTKYLREDGTWVAPTDHNTTYSFTVDANHLLTIASS